MIREVRTRVELTRNGAMIAELLPTTPPLIDCVSAGPIKTSMMGEFKADKTANWLTDEVRPYLILDGKEYPLGVYPVGTYAYTYGEDGTWRVRLECYDRGLVLDQTKTEEVLHLSKGTKYTTAVSQLLTSAGLRLYLVTDSDEVLATDREDWHIGTSVLQIVNDLLREINYQDLFFNNNGLAIARPRKTVDAGSIDHQYSSRDDVKVLHTAINVETDAFDAGNVFLAICNNPDLPAPITATAENRNPLSALSISRRGRRILKTVVVDNVPSRAALQEIANRLMTQSMMSSEICTIATALLPGHGVLDTVALDHPAISGLFEEEGWSITLAAGSPMTHYLRRSVLI